jgi:hypothetical protein
MTVITAKVYLNEGQDWFQPFNPDTAKLRLAASFDFQPNCKDPLPDLNDIFEQLNVGGEDFCPAEPYTLDYRRAGNRSLSVGDVVVLGETAWAVARFGWDIIPTSDLVKTIS